MIPLSFMGCHDRYNGALEFFSPRLNKMPIVDILLQILMKIMKETKFLFINFINLPSSWQILSHIAVR